MSTQAWLLDTCFQLGEDCPPLVQPTLGNLPRVRGGGSEGDPVRGEKALGEPPADYWVRWAWHHGPPGSLFPFSLLTTQARMLWGPLESSLGSRHLSPQYLWGCLKYPVQGRWSLGPLLG